MTEVSDAMVPDLGHRAAGDRSRRAHTRGVVVVEGWSGRLAGVVRA
ncbi:hypothetical protein [Nocardia stercoris]|nr:hypothetical protein [Nocardia stercoris]